MDCLFRKGIDTETYFVWSSLNCSDLLYIIFDGTNMNYIRPTEILTQSIPFLCNLSKIKGIVDKTVGIIGLVIISN